MRTSCACSFHVKCRCKQAACPRDAPRLSYSPDPCFFPSIAWQAFVVHTNRSQPIIEATAPPFGLARFPRWVLSRCKKEAPSRLHKVAIRAIGVALGLYLKEKRLGVWQPVERLRSLMGIRQVSRFITGGCYSCRQAGDFALAEHHESREKSLSSLTGGSSSPQNMPDTDLCFAQEACSQVLVGRLWLA